MELLVLGFLRVIRNIVQRTTLATWKVWDEKRKAEIQRGQAAARKVAQAMRGGWARWRAKGLDRAFQRWSFAAKSIKLSMWMKERKRLLRIFVQRWQDGVAIGYDERQKAAVDLLQDALARQRLGREAKRKAIDAVRWWRGRTARFALRRWSKAASEKRRSRMALLAIINKVRNKRRLQALNTWRELVSTQRKEERRKRKMRAVRERLLKGGGRACRRGKAWVADVAVAGPVLTAKEEREAWKLLEGLPTECVRRFALGKEYP